MPSRQRQSDIKWKLEIVMLLLLRHSHGPFRLGRAPGALVGLRKRLLEVSREASTMYLYKVLQTFKVIVSFRLLRCTLLVSTINQFTIKIVVAVL